MLGLLCRDALPSPMLPAWLIAMVSTLNRRHHHVAGRFLLPLYLAGLYRSPALLPRSRLCLCTAPALCISAVGMSRFGALLLQPQVAAEACVRAPCSASVRAQHDRERGDNEMQRENGVLVLLMKRLGENVWMRTTG